MRHWIIFPALLAVLIAAAPAAAAPLWKIDPPHCQIVFTVQHIFAPVMGRFKKFSGTIRFDPQDLKGSGAELIIQAASIDTDVAQRDQHMRSAEFFNVKRFPTIRFISQRIVSRGGDRYAAMGTLTIKDVSRQVEIPFTYLGSKTHPAEPKQVVAGFVARYTLDRLQYHVGTGRFYDQGMLGKEVKLYFHLELVRPR